MNNSGDINRYSGIINQQLYHYKLLHNKGSFFNQLVVNFLKYFETLFSFFSQICWFSGLQFIKCLSE